MSTKIGDLWFDVTADTTSALRAIGGLEGAASSAGSLIAGALSTAFDAAAYAAKTAIAFIVKDVIEMGSEFNIAGQRAVGMFTALAGSAEEAIDIVSQFNNLSLDQPIFDPALLQRVTAMLLTYGIAKDDVFELAKNIDLTSVALGKGIRGAEQLALAFGQIQGKGKLEGQEVRQLGEVGVNAYAVIAESIGKTRREVIELGRQGQLLAEDVLPILSDHLAKTFGPVAQNLLSTYGVQAQGVKNIFTDIGSALVEPFIGHTSGGVMVDFLSDVRTELLGLVDATDEGTFVLTGALAPLNDLSAALADGFAEMGTAFVGFLHDASGSEAISGFFNGLVEVIPFIVEGIMGTARFFVGMAEAIGPLIPSIEMIAGLLMNLVADAMPQIARFLIAATSAAAQFVVPLVQIGIGIAKFASPIIVTLLTAIADAMSLIADHIGLIQSVAAVWLAWEAGIIIAQLATETFISFALAPLIVSLGTIIAQAGLALLALGALKGADAAISGDVNYLNKDVPIYEKPFQLAGRYGFALGGGDRGAVEDAAMFEAGRAAAEDFNLSLLDNVETFAEARKQALEYGDTLGLTETQALDFANVVALAWKDATTPPTSIPLFNLFGSEMKDLERLFLDGAKAAEGYMRVFDEPAHRFIDVPAIEEAKDLIGLLKESADAAAKAVDALLNPDEGATIDDFLRGLPKLAEDLTTAMREAGSGILGDLERGGILDDVANQARKVINTLVDDYGMSLEEIKAMLDEQGLTAVIEALSDATQVAVEKVNPLIEAYGDMGYSVDILSTAVDSLENQRVTGLQTQIDDLTGSLDAARDAAANAKEALQNYFTGDTGGIQGAIDDLVLAIPGIGSDIEKALLVGGVQGEAGVRSAMAGVGKNLGTIFQAGLEQGLTPEEIIAMLGPVYGSISQEIGGALNRISSLDWTQGFTPAAAAEIQGWLSGILDPSQISDLFAGVTGGQSMVDSIQSQIDGLNAQLDVEGVFSQEQVQGAIDVLYPPEIQTQPVVTPEAAQAVYDEIQSVLDDDTLAVTIDNQLLTQSILDAAKDAANQIQLDFDSRVIFDPEALALMADVVGGEFAEIFRAKMLEDMGIEDPTKPGTILSVQPITAPGADVGTGRNIAVNNSIQITGAQSPRATASEVIAASSAAAGSGGRYTTINHRTLQEVYGGPE